MPPRESSSSDRISRSPSSACCSACDIICGGGDAFSGLAAFRFADSCADLNGLFNLVRSHPCRGPCKFSQMLCDPAGLHKGSLITVAAAQHALCCQSYLLRLQFGHYA